MNKISLFLPALALTLSACVEMTAPICTAETREDVLGLEGHYQVKIYEMDTLEMDSTFFAFERVSKGLYSINGQGGLELCRVSGTLYAQVPGADSTELYGAYRITSHWNEAGQHSFQMFLTGSSLSVLRAKGFPHRIEQKTGENGEITKSLLLLNDGLSPTETSQVLDPMGFSINFSPVHSLPTKAKLFDVRKHAQAVRVMLKHQLLKLPSP